MNGKVLGSNPKSPTRFELSNQILKSEVNAMINTVRLRSLLGWLGMLLPWIVFCLAYSDPYYTEYMNHTIPVPSISATYFISTCITPFMIILGSASFLLISYKGYTI